MVSGERDDLVLQVRLNTKHEGQNTQQHNRLSMRGVQNISPELGLGRDGVGEELDGGVLQVVVRRDHAQV